MNISIITRNPHWKIGGGETYLRTLYQAVDMKQFSFKEIIIGTENSVHKLKDATKPLKGVEVIENFSKHSYYLGQLNKSLVQELKDPSVDIVVINAGAERMISKKLLSNKKIIMIQHAEYDNYSPSLPDKIRLRLDSIFLRKGIIDNPLDVAMNVVYFTEENDKSELTKQNKAFIPIPSLIEGDANTSIKPYWLGRYIRYPKGLDFLNDVAAEIDVDTFGAGPDESVLTNTDKKGFLTKEDISVLNDYGVLFVTSNSEGFPIIIVEALSLGKLVVVRPTFSSAAFFDRCEGVYVIKEDTVSGFVSTYGRILSLSDREIRKRKKASKEFADKYLSIKEFGKRWESFFMETLNKL